MPSRATWRRWRSSICRRRSCQQTDARLEELRSTCRTPSVTSPVDGFVGKRNVDPGAMVDTNTADRLGRRHLAPAAGRQRRREGPAHGQRRRPGRGRGRCLPWREVQRQDRARRAGARSRDPHGRDGSRNSQRRQPAEAGHVCAHQPHRRRAQEHAGAPKSAVIDFESKRGVWMPNDENRAKFVPVEARHRGRRAASRSSAASRKATQFVTTGAAARAQQRSAAHRRPGRRSRRAAAARRPRRQAPAAAQVPGRQRPPAARPASAARPAAVTTAAIAACRSAVQIRFRSFGLRRL